MATEVNQQTPRELALGVAENLEKIAARIRDNDSIELIEATVNMTREIEQLEGLHPEQINTNSVINYVTGEETWTLTARLVDVKVVAENDKKGYRPAS